MTNPNEHMKGLLKIWWIPQIPMKPFFFPVSSPQQAQSLLSCLALYDRFQLANNIKPDYANAGGLLEYDPENIENGDPETGWTEWYDEQGRDIDNTEF